MFQKMSNLVLLVCIKKSKSNNWLSQSYEGLSLLVNSLTMHDVMINLQNAATVILDSNTKPEYGFGLNNLDLIWKTEFQML